MSYLPHAERGVQGFADGVYLALVQGTALVPDRQLCEQQLGLLPPPFIPGRTSNGLEAMSCKSGMRGGKGKQACTIPARLVACNAKQVLGCCLQAWMGAWRGTAQRLQTPKPKPCLA